MVGVVAPERKPPTSRGGESKRGSRRACAAPRQPRRDPTPETMRGGPAVRNAAKTGIPPPGGPPRCKSGHFGPFPAPGKLLPVFQIYFLFGPRPQKRCTAPPDDNGTGNRGLRVHLWPFSSHFHHFGGQNGGRYGFRCPHRPQIPTSCRQFAIRRSTSVVWDQ